MKFSIIHPSYNRPDWAQMEVIVKYKGCLISEEEFKKIFQGFPE